MVQDQDVESSEAHLNPLKDPTGSFAIQSRIGQGRGHSDRLGLDRFGPRLRVEIAVGSLSLEDPPGRLGDPPRSANTRRTGTTWKRSLGIGTLFAMGFCTSHA